PSSCLPLSIAISLHMPKCLAGRLAKMSSQPSSLPPCWHDSYQQTEHLPAPDEKSERSADQRAHYRLGLAALKSFPLLRHAPREAKKSPKSRVIIVRQPHCAEP